MTAATTMTVSGYGELADAAGQRLLQVVGQRGAFAQDDEGFDHPVGDVAQLLSYLSTMSELR